MIIRLFRGVARSGAEESFERYLHDEAVPMFHGQAGMRAVHVAAPSGGTDRAFLVLTLWDDIAAIRAFAGPDWSRPVLSPLERELLVEKEVSHFHDDAPRLSLDVPRRLAYVDGEPVELPPQEFSLLISLAARPGQPITPDEIGRSVWPGSALVTSDDVRRAVYRLRRALGDQNRNRPLIRNRRGHGYVLDP